MILKSIYLHPFAGTKDKLYSFLENGITEVKGPNETGKSTLARAIHAAMFIPVKLNKKETVAFSSNLPIGGDQAKVTLIFSNAGNEYTLEKVWGKNPSVKLSGQGLSLTDNDEVGKKLLSFYSFQEGTFKNVFYLTQSELSTTSEEIENSGDKMDSLKNLLGGGQINYGGVKWTQMKQELSNEIEKYYKRWDETQKRPEGNREIENPWRNDIGRILDSYYKYRGYEIKLNEIKSIESAIDDCQKAIALLKQDMNDRNVFVTQYKPLVSDLRIRNEMENELGGLVREIEQIKSAILRWPVIDAELKNSATFLQNLQDEISNLQTELKSAQKAAEGVTIREQFKIMEASKGELDAETKTLLALSDVDGDKLEELEELQEKIRDADIKLEAQKLQLSLIAKEAAVITISDPISGGKEFTLSKGDEKVISSLPGLFELTTDNFYLKVSSEAGSAEQLASAKELAHSKMVDLLKELNANSIDELFLRSSLWTAQSQKVNQLLKAFNRLCSKKSFETMHEEVASLESLPASRSVVELSGLNIEKQTAFNMSKNKLTALQEEQQGLIGAFQSQSTLLESLGKKMQEKSIMESTLAGLKNLPQGFEDNQTFFRAFDEAEYHLKEKKDLLSKKETELAVLEEKQPEQTGDEVRELSEHHYKIWQRSMADGDALVCLQDAIDKEEAKGGGDPYVNYRKRLIDLFSQLTDGKYCDIDFNELLPLEVHDPEKSIPAAWLSQGARDSLALALRLAMAEFYLDGNEGFMLLDDPMTNMDSVRKKLASTCLNSFAVKRQMILFTCAE